MSYYKDKDSLRINLIFFPLFLVSESWCFLNWTAIWGRRNELWEFQIVFLARKEEERFYLRRGGNKVWSARSPNHLSLTGPHFFWRPSIDMASHLRRNIFPPVTWRKNRAINWHTRILDNAFSADFLSLNTKNQKLRWLPLIEKKNTICPFWTTGAFFEKPSRHLIKLFLLVSAELRNCVAFILSVVTHNKVNKYLFFLFMRYNVYLNVIRGFFKLCSFNLFCEIYKKKGIL